MKKNSFFGNCKALTSIDLNSFNTSKVTDAALMFFYCQSLKWLDLSNFDTSNFVHTQQMFEQTDLVSLKLGSKFSKITSDMYLKNPASGWASTQNPTVSVSGSGKYAVIENSGVNTYFKLKSGYIGSGTENDPYLVFSYDALRKLFTKADASMSRQEIWIALGCDISESLSNDAYMPIEKAYSTAIHFDLAGHTMTQASTWTEPQYIFKITNGYLTIDDSVGTGKLLDSTVSSDSNCAMLYYAPAESSLSVFTINGGTFESHAG